MQELRVLFSAKVRMVRNNILYAIKEESKVKGMVVTLFGSLLLLGAISYLPGASSICFPLM